MVAKWWRYHRGKVLPISGIGVSVCFSLSPLVFYDLIQATDWRVAWRILALCSGVGVALYGWLVYRDNPEECGLSIDAGIPPRDKQRDDPEFTVVKEFTREEAIRSSVSVCDGLRFPCPGFGERARHDSPGHFEAFSAGSFNWRSLECGDRLVERSLSVEIFRGLHGLWNWSVFLCPNDANRWVNDSVDDCWHEHQ